MDVGRGPFTSPDGQVVRMRQQRKDLRYGKSKLDRKRDGLVDRKISKHVRSCDNDQQLQLFGTKSELL